VNDYEQFLDRKSQLGAACGFAPIWMPDFLFDFQRALVEWAIRKGRAAIFADCGLGKTIQQLVWAENVVRHTNGRVLILTPLAVGPQTVLEGEKFGIECRRSRDGSIPARGIIVSNYEKLHLFDANNFAGVVCDESSILKHFSGVTQMAVTRFMLKVPYRLLCTATAAPNDYIELGTSSEALGELGHSGMLSRFFRQSDKQPHRMQEIKEWRAGRGGNHFAKLSFRVSQQIGQWRLKGHAVTPFWRWVCSWARACRQPSDLGFDDARFVLPTLTEREHIIMPKRPADGMLFTLPAFGLNEEREERRRTLDERCEFVAELVKQHKYSVIWCHLNSEGDLLERIIPNSLQVAGRHDDDYKEAAAEWFIGRLCICNDDRFSAKLAAWQKDQRGIGRSGIGIIEKSELHKLSNTPSGIEKNGEPISPSTIKPISPSTSSHVKERQRKTTSVVGDMEPIQNIERCTSLALSDGKRRTPRSASINECESTASQSMTTIASLPTRAEDAPSAGVTRAETAEDQDFTSTIAIPLSECEACSVPTVISASENSQTTQSALNAPPCICGHLGGPRRLISKSRIFGFGLNLQHCAHVVTFATHSYEQFYQSVRRCWRFGQTSPVTVDIVATEGERHVRENMTRKAQAADRMFTELVAQMHLAEQVARTARGQDEVELPIWV